MLNLNNNNIFSKKISFGAQFEKKPVNVEVVKKDGDKVFIVNKFNESFYDMPSDEFNANFNKTNKPNIYSSKPGTLRNIEYPEKSRITDIHGKTKSTNGKFVVIEKINEETGKKYGYPVDPYYIRGNLVPLDKEAKEIMQAVDNVTNLRKMSGDANEIKKFTNIYFKYRPNIYTIAGYSAPPDEKYADSSKIILNDIFKGKDNRYFGGIVTSPTLTKGSIDDSATNIGHKFGIPIVYTTAEDYLPYINPENFPNKLNKAMFDMTPKFYYATGDAYSEAGATMSKGLFVDGGRNFAAEKDFVNFINKEKPVTLIDNYAIDRTAMKEDGKNINNASSYIINQLDDFFNGRKLRHAEVGGFNEKFLKNNVDKLKGLVKTVAYFKA